MKWERWTTRKGSSLSLTTGQWAQVYLSMLDGRWWVNVNSVFSPTDAATLEDAESIAVSQLADQLRKASAAIGAVAGGGAGR